MDVVILSYASPVGALPVSLYMAVYLSFSFLVQCMLILKPFFLIMISGALGQVMQRMHLSWYGRETGPASASVTCRTVAILFAAYLACDYIFALFESILLPSENTSSSSSSNAYDPYHTNTNNPQGGDVPPAFYVFYFLRGTMHFAFWLYMLIAVTNTRRYIRNKYAIPEQSCHGMEDCCCAFWCQCCNIAQMARHTADYDTYSAKCCSDTGLPPTAPAIV